MGRAFSPDDLRGDAYLGLPPQADMVRTFGAEIGHGEFFVVPRYFFFFVPFARFSFTRDFTIRAISP